MPEGFKEFNEGNWAILFTPELAKKQRFRLSEQRMKFLTRIEQEAKELEINGFLHNSRGTNKIDSTSSNTQQE